MVLQRLGPFGYACLVTFLLLTPTQARLVLGPIPPNDEECLLIRTSSWKDPHTHPRILYGGYELVEGPNADPLSVFVMDVHDKVLYQSDAGRERDNFHLPIQPLSKYWLCVQNAVDWREGEEEEPQHPDELPRTVGLSYYVKAPTIVQKTDGDMDKKHNEWMGRAQALSLTLQNLVDHQAYMRLREASHREVTEQTFTDVLLWTLAEAAVVCIVAAGQILYFRKYLEKKESYL